MFLYVAKRARPDLQVTVAFLCKQVKCLNVGNWKKLCRLVRFVRATIYLLLIVGSDGMGNMVWSIDDSFAVHMDMKSHRHRLLFNTGDRILHLRIIYTEGQHKKFNWIRACWCWWWYWICGMGKPKQQRTSKGISCGSSTEGYGKEDRLVTRQHKHHQNVEGWQTCMWVTD